MDRNAKLAAAKRRLKQFKRKKDYKKQVQKDVMAFRGNGSHDTQLPGEVVDEISPNMCTVHGDCSTPSTVVTTETILQVSAKLNGLASEADTVIEDAALASSEEKLQIIDHSNIKEAKAISDFSKKMEERNIELASNLSSVSHENAGLKRQCQHLLEEVSSLQMVLNSTQTRHDEGNVLENQLKVQLQTIGVLVSEKQELQQELLVAQSSLHSLNVQQDKADDEMKHMRDEVASLKRNLQSRTAALELAENNISQINSDYCSCTEEVRQMKEMLEKERFQFSELLLKLRSKEESYRELQMSYTDIHEKLDMTDVLVQQLSASNALNAVSQQNKLQEENETMTSCLTEYRQAFQQLKVERQNIEQEFKDAQKIWEDQLKELHERVKFLEIEKQDMYENYTVMRTSLEQKPTLSTEGPESQAYYSQRASLENELEEVMKNYRMTQEEILSQRRSNEQLSALVREKESCITELENELQQAKIAVQANEHLLIEAHNDKVTISRALLQNSQLKDQLEEIQDGFIRMSNDKMDLATKASCLEQTNKDLLSLLKKGITGQKGLSKSVEQSSSYELTELQSNYAQRSLDDTLFKVEGACAEHDDSAIPYSFQCTEALEAISQAELHNQESNLLSSSGDSVQPSRESNRLACEQDSLKCFDAQKMLYEKFTVLTSEKADLLNRLELLEHANTQLQNECDTIGEYIALYHNQRQVLKCRHREKDEYISCIVREREAMQGKVEQLQTLIVSLLKGQQKLTSVHSTEVLVSAEYNEQELRPRLLQSQPNSMPDVSEEIFVHSESSNSGYEDMTASQILSLLEDIHKPPETTVCQKMSMPSGFGMNYIGPYTAI